MRRPESNSFIHLSYLLSGLLLSLLCSIRILAADASACETASTVLEGSCAVSRGDLKMNDIQAVGSHNSYKIAIPAPEMALIRQNREQSALTLDYYHSPLSEQLDLGMRQLELDIVYDPAGGRYAEPLLPSLALGLPGAQPFDASDLQLPGFKVLHVPDMDVRSHCPTWVACLKEIRAWSKLHSDHVPILIMFNAKEGGSSYPGSIEALRFDEAAYDALDAEILSVFGLEELITPDQVRGNAATLREGVLAGGWPSLDAARGKVFFAMDERPEKIAVYMRGRESLQGLPIFVNSASEDAPHAAYFTINDPVRDQQRIHAAVKTGFVVRTRADADTREARENSTQRREAAFSSGAQYVSTDYYYARPEFSDYSVQLPRSGAARCNPLRTDSRCTSLQTGDQAVHTSILNH